MIPVAITGSMGSGKTTVAAILAEWGYPVICADVLARDVVRRGRPAFDAIVRRFGPGVVATSGELDRVALAAIVFADRDELQALEAIVHPAVEAERQRLVGELGPLPPAAPVFFDIPLLYEKGLDSCYDAVIVAYADEATLVRRVMKRDGMAEQDVRRRLANQIPIDEKACRTPHVVDTRQDAEGVRSQLRHVLAQIAGGAFAH